MFFVERDLLRFGGRFDPGFDRVGTSLACMSQNIRWKLGGFVFKPRLQSSLINPKKNVVFRYII